MMILSSSPSMQALLLGAALLLSLHIFFLGPLKGEAEQMHQQQIDPTDIVKIPYDLTRLGCYVIAVAIVALLVSAQQQPATMPNSSVRLRTVVSHWVQLSILCFGMMIVTGRDLEHWQHTALSAIYVTALCLCDADGRVAVTAPTRITTQLRMRLRNKSNKDTIVRPTVAQVCLAVTVALQILRLYDRGWQVQRWPVPVILGSTYGWVLGHVVLWTLRAVSSVTHQRQQRRTE